VCRGHVLIIGDVIVFRTLSTIGSLNMFYETSGYRRGLCAYFGAKLIY